MLKFLVVGIASLAFVGTAVAADMPRPQPAAQAKCDRIDKELAAIAANDPGAKVKFTDLTEQRRVAGQRLSELVDTVYDD